MGKKHLFYITVLSVMLSIMLAGTILTSQACILKKTWVHFYPDDYVWGEPPTDPWRAHIKLSVLHKWQINESSILLEGRLAPEETKNRCFIITAYFDGSGVVSILESKLGHDGVVEPGIYKVELSILGKLISGETFKATGTIKVIVPSGLHPCHNWQI